LIGGKYPHDFEDSGQKEQHDFFFWVQEQLDFYYCRIICLRIFSFVGTKFYSILILIIVMGPNIYYC